MMPRSTRSTVPGRRKDAGQEGFGLVELIVAVLLSVALLVALAGTLRSALSGSRDNRFRQEATSLAMERLEVARAVEWDQLAMSEIDSAAPLIDANEELLLAAAAELPEDETLRTCVTGTLEPRIDHAVQDVTFTTWTYVTQLSDTLRRVYVLVEWNGEDGERSHRTSTIISTISARTAAATTSSVFPDAAITAAGDVNLHPGHTLSVPAGTHAADILANGNVGNSDATVDGSVVAGGTVNVSPANVQGTIEQNAGTPVDLPGAAEIEAWRADLRAEAQAGTILWGNQRFKDTTVTGPIYIEGSLVVEGTVTINGSGPIYATESIKLQGGPTVTTDATFFVSDVLVEFSGGTEYIVTDYGSASPTTGGAISFGVNSKALKLTGSSTGYTQGVAYAPYGGVLLSGTSAWHGAIIAGGADGLGYVELSGGSWVEYPANLVPSSRILTGLQPEPVASACP
jgi:type II secretory pathway pseudopilin PulG